MLRTRPGRAPRRRVPPRLWCGYREQPRPSCPQPAPPRGFLLSCHPGPGLSPMISHLSCSHTQAPAPTRGPFPPNRTAPALCAEKSPRPRELSGGGGGGRRAGSQASERALRGSPLGSGHGDWEKAQLGLTQQMLARARRCARCEGARRARQRAKAGPPPATASPGSERRGSPGVSLLSYGGDSRCRQAATLRIDSGFPSGALRAFSFRAFGARRPSRCRAGDGIAPPPHDGPLLGGAPRTLENTREYSRILAGAARVLGAVVSRATAAVRSHAGVTPAEQLVNAGFFRFSLT